MDLDAPTRFVSARRAQSRLPSPVAFLVLPILFMAGSLETVFADPPPDLAAELRIIRSVRAEGQGNAEASAAWTKVAQSEAAAVMPILEAMDGSNDYALNWLRAAVESIAERELKTGKTIPQAELGTFLLDTRHHPRARRLAFELTARVDPSTAETLLSGMLNDPSLEIRYDAVHKVMARANQSLSLSNRVGAGVLLQQALAAARDPKQVDDIAKRLQELGQPVDLQKLFGFLVTWKVIGPFDNTEGKGFATVYPPEEGIDLAAELEGKTGKVRWKDYASKHKHGMIDVNQVCGKLKGVLAYATTDFYSESPQIVELRLGGKNSWKVWLNGKLLFGRDEYHTDAEIDQYPMPAQLQPGRNTILVKVCQNEQVEDWTNEWEFQLRVTDSLGTPIVSAPGVPATAGAREFKSNRSTE
jgi:hypothetical protein